MVTHHVPREAEPGEGVVVAMVTVDGGELEVEGGGEGGEVGGGGQGGILTAETSKQLQVLVVMPTNPQRQVYTCMSYLCKKIH